MDGHRDAAVGRFDGDRDRGAGRVLAGVGQPLLHHPVDHPGGHRWPVAGPVVQPHRLPGPGGLVDQRRQVGERHTTQRRGVGLQHAEHVTQLLQRLPGGDPDQLGLLPHQRRIAAGGQLERAGVQRDQRHLVGQQVVHLAGDAGALGRPGRLLVPAPLGLGPLGLLPPRRGQRLPGRGVDARPDQQAGRPDRREQVLPVDCAGVDPEPGGEAGPPDHQG